ncbi:hypothetical protein [Amycolatopsis balhimycina]|uniref:hypothetical protein n=1 Tax=Amycolatopsis balhimycina TaxID=208443 RepID=UPI00037F4F5D|nr:hypothetical protein [Amycolatopsis balhimycina]
MTNTTASASASQMASSFPVAMLMGFRMMVFSVSPAELASTPSPITAWASPLASSMALVATHSDRAPARNPTTILGAISLMECRVCRVW